MQRSEINPDDLQTLAKQFVNSLNPINDRVCDELKDIQDQAYQLGLNRGLEIAAQSRKARQREILDWACVTFGQATADITGERIRRFLEEALELAQAVGLDQEAAENMVEYVYARPTGHINQEIGQVGVSLLALAEHLHINAEHEELVEFRRITSLPADHWQSRQNAKAEKGIALPSS